MTREVTIAAELGRWKVSLAVAAAAVAAFAAARGPLAQALPLVAGVVFVAAGASALNQWQERDLDRLMSRTRFRPLPARRIDPGRALVIGVLAVALGLNVLWQEHGPGPAAVALAAVFWYNGVYTPSKRWSAFAVVWGGLVGVAAPVIGWLAAGRSATEPTILALAFFLWTWQVPHFWLLAALHGDDYDVAGLPSLAGRFSSVQIARMAAAWIAATSGAAMILPACGAGRSPGAAVLLVLSAVWLAATAIRLLTGDGEAASLKSAFTRLNAAALAVGVSLMA